MLKFQKVPRGANRGSREKPATQFFALSKKMCHKNKKV